MSYSFLQIHADERSRQDMLTEMLVGANATVLAMSSKADTSKNAAAVRMEIWDPTESHKSSLFN